MTIELGIVTNQEDCALALRTKPHIGLILEWLQRIPLLSTGCYQSASLDADL